MAMQIPHDSSDKLDSWKEIAAYLEVNPRTAQKYEKDLSLPVRRLPGKRGRVVSSKRALDQWKQHHLKAPPWWSNVGWLRAYALATSVGLAVLMCMVALDFGGWRTHPSVAAGAEKDEVILSDGTRQVASSLLDVVSTTRVGLLPGSVALGRNGTRAYVANAANHTISVINTTTSPPSVITTVDVGMNPHGLASSPRNSVIYVPNNDDDTVCVVDASTHSVIATRQLAGRPRQAAFTPDGRRVYVTTRGGSVAVFETSTHSIVESLPLGNQPYGIVFSPDGTRAYVAQRNAAQVAVLDATASPLAVVARASVGEFPQIVTITPDGSKVYVTNLHSDSVSVIDTVHNSVIATVPVGHGPYWVAVTPDGKRAYVSNEASNSISVIETATDKVVASIMAPIDSPRGLAIARTPAGAELSDRHLIVGTGGSATSYYAAAF